MFVIVASYNSEVKLRMSVAISLIVCSYHPVQVAI